MSNSVLVNSTNRDILTRSTNLPQPNWITSNESQPNYACITTTWHQFNPARRQVFAWSVY